MLAPGPESATRAPVHICSDNPDPVDIISGEDAEATVGKTGRQGDTLAHRTLFVQSQTEIGGAETSLLTALGAVDRSQLLPAVAVLGFGRGDLPKRLRAAGIDVFEVRAGRLRNLAGWLGAVWRLRSLVRSSNSELLVANGYHPHLYSHPAARLSGAKSAVFCHDFPAPRRRACMIESLSFRLHADGYFAPSMAMARAVEQRISGRRPVQLVPNGVDTSRFRPNPRARAALRAEMGITPENLVVTVAGRLQPWKGQHVFLKAASGVAAARPDARFVLVGGTLFGENRDYPRELREQAERLGISERVIFAGNRSDMPAVYAASDILVHSSVTPEPFGVVIIEAMSCGCPVVVSAAGGAAELFEEGISGLGYPPGDSGELARRILRLLEDADLRRKLGDSGRRRAQKEYTAATSASALSKAVVRVIRPQAPSPQIVAEGENGESRGNTPADDSVMTGTEQ
jgi:glycosyltransferase involved in cell wall biosynthesis